MNKSFFKVFSLITILALMLAALPMQNAQRYLPILSSARFMAVAATLVQFTLTITSSYSIGNFRSFTYRMVSTVRERNSTGNFGSATNLITPIGFTCPRPVFACAGSDQRAGWISSADARYY